MANLSAVNATAVNADADDSVFTLGFDLRRVEIGRAHV